ncbi:MAG: RNA polymerase sigma factor [Saprospiraceae bacterium]|nr:RNA polymerase sigma factor [Saprospiraceae bacterium]
MKEETSDDHILALLASAATHERGFRLLMSCYQEPLYRHIRRMVYDHDDANDIIQNTFIKVFKSVERFEGKSKLYTWLYRIATNEAITFLNTRNRKETDTIDTIENTHLTSQLRADTFFDGNEVQIKLQEAISILPDKQRTVFNLRYYEEMPYEEMSEVLSTSVGALKASYHHAVKKVETFFKGVEFM